MMKKLLLFGFFMPLCASAANEAGKAFIAKAISNELKKSEYEKQAQNLRKKIDQCFKDLDNLPEAQVLSMMGLACAELSQREMATCINKVRASKESKHFVQKLTECNAMKLELKAIQEKSAKLAADEKNN
jgi:hypothetical protein